jgi:tRNA threonylcarbamoyladenosine biosynthesis protein TsaE
MSGLRNWQWATADLAAVERLADALVNHLPPPLTIGLVGTLGAGKTSFAQAIARAAGIDSTDVTSPTFSLLQSHQGRIQIHHLDAYRVADEDEFLELGVSELFADPGAWTLVEWADRVSRELPAETLWIKLSVDDDPRTRTIELSSASPIIGARLESAIAAARK